MKNTQLPYRLLTIGLAFVFIWFGYEKIFITLNWVGWMPLWLEGFLSLDIISWTKIIGVIEIILGVSLFIPKISKYAAVLVVLHLIAVLTVTGLNEIGIRDTGLLFMALALLSFHFSKSSARIS